jgi:hypothetical protein
MRFFLYLSSAIFWLNIIIFISLLSYLHISLFRFMIFLFGYVFPVCLLAHWYSDPINKLKTFCASVSIYSSEKVINSQTAIDINEICNISLYWPWCLFHYWPWCMFHLVRCCLLCPLYAEHFFYQIKITTRSHSFPSITAQCAIYYDSVITTHVLVGFIPVLLSEMRNFVRFTIDILFQSHIGSFRYIIFPLQFCTSSIKLINRFLPGSYSFQLHEILIMNKHFSIFVCTLFNVNDGHSMIIKKKNLPNNIIKFSK